MSDLLAEDEIRAKLSSIPAWMRKDTEITRTVTLADFAAAMKFVNQVAEIAEKANHHPDIDIRWNKVRLNLSTHSKGGLTANDFALAEQIDRLG
jgi:4a-hydroxytetrahydrobiopterin dehydratase